MNNSLIISLIVLFLHSTMWEGMIFGGIRKLINPDKVIAKPLYTCPICMSPWWGTLIYLVFFHGSFKSYLLTIGAASGLSVIYVCLMSIREIAWNLEK